MDLMNAFRRVWARVRETYESGYMVYERGLQAALYEALRREFSERRVVAEPHWGEVENQQVPDLVMVSRNEISDIFELKFSPHWSLRIGSIEHDMRKLLEYNGEKPVTLDPSTGQFDQYLQIRADCRRHCVVVTKENSRAVQPEYIPDGIILWYGRVRPEPEPEPTDWGVCIGQMPD